MNGWDVLACVFGACVWIAMLVHPRAVAAWDRLANSCWSCRKPAVHHPDGSFQTHCVACPPRTVTRSGA